MQFSQRDHKSVATSDRFQIYLFYFIQLTEVWKEEKIETFRHEKKKEWATEKKLIWKEEIKEEKVPAWVEK